MQTCIDFSFIIAFLSETNSQNEYQNVQTLAAYPASTSNTVQNTTLFPSPNSNNKHEFPSEGFDATNTSINLEVDTDDLDFAPNPDGELMSGKTLHTKVQLISKNIVKCYKDFFGYFNALESYSEL